MPNGRDRFQTLKGLVKEAQKSLERTQQKARIVRGEPIVAAGQRIGVGVPSPRVPEKLTASERATRDIRLKETRQARERRGLEELLGLSPEETQGLGIRDLRKLREEQLTPTQPGFLEQLTRGLSGFLQKPRQAAIGVGTEFLLRQLGQAAQEETPTTRIQRRSPDADPEALALFNQKQSLLDQGLTEEQAQGFIEDQLRSLAFRQLQEAGLQQQNNPDAFITEANIQNAMDQLRGNL